MDVVLQEWEPPVWTSFNKKFRASWSFKKLQEVLSLRVYHCHCYCISYLLRTYYLNTNSAYTKFSDIITRFRIFFPIFEIVDLQTITHTRYKFTISLDTKFHVSYSLPPWHRKVKKIFALSPWYYLTFYKKLKLFLFFGWRAPISFFVFPCNGTPVEWNWQGKTDVLGEKPVPVPLCPPQIPHWLTPGSKPGLRGERPAINRLSHGTGIKQYYFNKSCIFFKISYHVLLQYPKFSLVSFLSHDVVRSSYCCYRLQ